MDEILKRQNSTAVFQRHHSGCMWGMFEFVDFHHLHVSKMLAYNRRNGDGKHAAGSKPPSLATSISLSDKENQTSDAEANRLVQEKVPVTEKRYAKSFMRTFISRRASKKKDEKHKITPLVARLPRSLSIHYLECNDYVLPDDMIFVSETSAGELNAHDIVSSGNSQHLSVPPKGQSGKLPEVCSVMNNTADEGHNQLNEIGNNLQAKQETPLNVLQDPNCMLANCQHDRLTSCGKQGSSGITLTKSSSFPAGLSDGKNSELSKICPELKKSNSFGDQDHKLKAGNADTSPGIVKSGHSLVLPVSYCERKNVDTDAVASSHFKTLRRRIKHVIKENRKESDRISLDGVLHKLPYGQKVPEDIKKEKLGISEWRTLNRSGSENSRSKSGTGGSSNYVHEYLRRSRSLTESVDRYTRLLEQNSARELNKLPQRPNIIEDDGVLRDRKSRVTFGKILSSPEFELHISTDGEVDTFASEEPKWTSTLVPTKETMELETSAETSVEGSASETMHAIPQQPVANECDHSGTGEISDPCTEEANSSAEGIACETMQVIPQLPVVNEYDHSGTCEISDPCTEEGGPVPPVEQETGIEVASDDNSTAPHLVSVLDSCFQEGPLSPAKDSVLKGSGLESICLQSDELDSLTPPEDQQCIDFCSVIDAVRTIDDCKELIPGAATDLNAFHVQVDEKDEAPFNYLRHMLMKFGFTDEVSAIDPSILEEAEGSPHCINTGMGDEIDKTPEQQQLLFDLINETLLELYASSISYWPGFSHLNSRIRSMPGGRHALEELWAEITWHLHFQPQPDASLDDMVARDFTKNDGWMQLRWDTEFIGLDLEDSILDDLLDEIILAV